MKGWRLAVVAGFGLAATAAWADQPEAVKVYTSEDLDRMFGPAPPSPSEPVDKSTPEDWRWVEQFLDRQYTRIEADRSWELNKRTLDIAEQRTAPRASYPYGGVAWSLGYPASTWWNNVWSNYSGYGYNSSDDDCRKHGGRVALSTVSGPPRGAHVNMRGGHRKR